MFRGTGRGTQALALAADRPHHADLRKKICRRNADSCARRGQRTFDDLNSQSLIPCPGISSPALLLSVRRHCLGKSIDISRPSMCSKTEFGDLLARGFGGHLHRIG